MEFVIIYWLSLILFKIRFLINIIHQTCILRALDSETPVHIYPAMNTHMYNHPLTQPQLNTLKTVLNYNIHGPIQKNLACGDTGQCNLDLCTASKILKNGKGIGAMVDYKDIIDYLISNCK